MNTLNQSIKGKKMMLANYDYDFKAEILGSCDFDKMRHWEHEYFITRNEIETLTIKWNHDLNTRNKLVEEFNVLVQSKKAV